MVYGIRTGPAANLRKHRAIPPPSPPKRKGPIQWAFRGRGSNGKKYLSTIPREIQERIHLMVETQKREEFQKKVEAAQKEKQKNLDEIKKLHEQELRRMRNERRSRRRSYSSCSDRSSRSYSPWRRSRRDERSYKRERRWSSGESDGGKKQKRWERSLSGDRERGRQTNRSSSKDRRRERKRYPSREVTVRNSLAINSSISFPQYYPPYYPYPAPLYYPPPYGIYDPYGYSQSSFPNVPSQPFLGPVQSQNPQPQYLQAPAKSPARPSAVENRNSNKEIIAFRKKIINMKIEDNLPPSPGLPAPARIPLLTIEESPNKNTTALLSAKAAVAKGNIKNE